MNLSVYTPTHASTEPLQTAPRRAPAAPSVSAHVSLRPHQTTEALLPKDLAPAGQGADKQDVSGTGQEQTRLIDDIRLAAEKANKYLKQADTHLEFYVGEETGRIIISVIDSETKEVVRQIPPDTMLRFSGHISEMRGLLFEASG